MCDYGNFLVKNEFLTTFFLTSPFWKLCFRLMATCRGWGWGVRRRTVAHDAVAMTPIACSCRKTVVMRLPCMLAPRRHRHLDNQDVSNCINTATQRGEQTRQSNQTAATAATGRSITSMIKQTTLDAVTLRCKTHLLSVRSDMHVYKNIGKNFADLQCLKLDCQLCGIDTKLCTF